MIVAVHGTFLHSSNKASRKEEMIRYTRTFKVRWPQQEQSLKDRAFPGKIDHVLDDRYPKDDLFAKCKKRKTADKCKQNQAGRTI